MNTIMMFVTFILFLVLFYWIFKEKDGSVKLGELFTGILWSIVFSFGWQIIWSCIGFVFLVGFGFILLEIVTKVCKPSFSRIVNIKIRIA